MNENFFFSWILGIFIIFLTSPIGSLIVWKRISFFGDSLSHASILGIAISYMINIDYLYINFFLVLIFLSCILIIEKYSYIEIDAIISILMNISLSLGTLFLDIISKNKKVDIPHYFFGDFSHIIIYDILRVFLMSSIILLILSFFWENFLLIIINPELAQIQGVNTFFMRFLLLFLISFVICLAIKFFGVLLMTSLLIIPVSISQRFSSSPEHSVAMSFMISVFSFTVGLLISYYFHILISPIIVLILSIFFLFSLIYSK
ncbi:metal ABC transporter permease [Buchnera aphidicola]|uniref:metal ABC transporter permease n=1 Tax=Buchnera aphidicola TaxID=9 RepID=UPI002093F11B|nr:metal ABC transporter permease [Buchnera aphidicola]USS94338.1 metal ABC transporter permease [Buchnera aphidicola (Sipha maydis)]